MCGQSWLAQATGCSLGICGAPQMPKEHPVAWASQLWPHIRLIQIMRRERKTWVEITQHLESRHNVKVTFRTVRNFFKRATDPDRKRPLGFPALSEAPPGATLPPEFK